MSFILDALKKAESRRGQPPPSMPAETPLGDIAPRQNEPRRMAVTTVALASGIVVIATLAWWLGRQSSPPAAMTDTAAPAAMMQLPVDEGSREIRPLDREADRSTRRRTSSSADNTVQRVAAPPAGSRVQPGQSRPVEAAPSLPQVTIPPRSNEDLPSYEEIVLSGRVQLPALHLDIHVYADAPERRFVFINNRKYRQGQQLDEGGQVERITPFGAVLVFRGHRFELTPD